MNPTVGTLVCINPSCAVAGLPTTRANCVTCGNPTHRSDEPGLAIPTPKAQPPSMVPKIEAGVEVGKKTVYGGFWVLVAIVAAIAGVSLLSNGQPAGLVSLIVAVLAGIYARYIFRGGRFRIMFW